MLNATCMTCLCARYLFESQIQNQTGTVRDAEAKVKQILAWTARSRMPDVVRMMVAEWRE
jgi:hypothetical protein